MTTEPATECAFCRIVADYELASVVHENRGAVAFIDQRQPHPGHTLVVPKRHVQTVFDLDEETGALLISLVAEVARALRTAIPSDGMSVWQSNGSGAHQEIPHVHFHLMPRHTGDGLLRTYPHRVEVVDRAEMDRQAAMIRGALESKG